MSASALNTVITIKSTLKGITWLEETILRELADAGVHSDVLYAVRTALDEALNNAHEHGNGGDPCKEIRIQTVYSPQEIEFTVSDQGNGFNPAVTLHDPTAPERIELDRGRGLFLIRESVSRLAFNEAGNQITFALPLAPAGSAARAFSHWAYREILVVELMDSALSLSTGEMNAQLQQLVNDGHTRFLFDLKRLSRITSAVIAVLIRFVSSLEPIAGLAMIARPTPQVELALHSTRVTDLIPIYPEISAAISALAPTP